MDSLYLLSNRAIVWQRFCVHPSIPLPQLLRNEMRFAVCGGQDLLGNSFCQYKGISEIHPHTPITRPPIWLLFTLLWPSDPLHNIWDSIFSHICFFLTSIMLFMLSLFVVWLLLQVHHIMIMSGLSATVMQMRFCSASI